MEKIYFENRNFYKVKKDILQSKYSKNQIFNFVNAYSIYLFKTHKRFRESILKKENINFPDGATVSFFLSLMNFKKIKRLKGPNFTYQFLKDKELNESKKHLFVGLDKNSLERLQNKFKNLEAKNIFCHEIPLIKQRKYDDKDLIKKINVLKVDYIWIGLGNPKQEILANDITDKIKSGIIFNVGVALDYLRDKKIPAPKFFEKTGLEWFYRMMTDFKHTLPKVIKSFIGQFYLFLVVGLRK